MKRVLENPPANGLLLTHVARGMPAEAYGLRPGDVLVRYDGKATTTQRALIAAATRAARAEKDAVRLEYVRNRARRRIEVAPGRLGVRTVPVRKGRAIQVRPPATRLRLDFSPVARMPYEDWAAFYLGERKTGYEHHRYALERGKLLLSYEVAFDGGERWGLNHYIAELELATTPRLEPRRSTFRNPLSRWKAEGKLGHTIAGSRARHHWSVAARGPRGRADRNKVLVPRDAAPSYVIATLPLFMPRQRGACLHVTPIAEGTGELGDPSAIVARGEELVAVGRKRVKAFRYDVRSYGRTVGSTWVRDHRIVRVDYGGLPWAHVATKREALAGVPRTLKPRTG